MSQPGKPPTSAIKKVWSMNLRPPERKPEFVLQDLSKPNHSQRVDNWTQILREDLSIEKSNHRKLQTSIERERLVRAKERAIKRMGTAGSKEIKRCRGLLA